MLIIKCDTQIPLQIIMEISKQRFCSIFVEGQEFFCFFVYNQTYDTRKYIIDVYENKNGDIFFMVSENLIDKFSKFGKYIIYALIKKYYVIKNRHKSRLLNPEIELIRNKHPYNPNFLDKYLKFKIEYLKDYHNFLKTKKIDKWQIPEIIEKINSCQNELLNLKIKL